MTDPAALIDSVGGEEPGPSPAGDGRAYLDIQDLNLWYGKKQALFDVDLPIPAKKITSFIGPSGCGKSTLLRCINRLNDLIGICRIEGRILWEGMDINGPDIELHGLRSRIGMVFQKSNPFPKSIYENVAYGPRIHGIKSKPKLDELVEKSLRGAALWDEVKDRLKESALGMSGGQMQRLCIARALAVEPDIILFDEPCSALDPIATGKIEDLMEELKKDYTQIIVTHSMQQASRVSDHTAFFYLGKLIEFGETKEVFTRPVEKQTEDYISGRFG